MFPNRNLLPIVLRRIKTAKMVVQLLDSELQKMRMSSLYTNLTNSSVASHTGDRVQTIALLTWVPPTGSRSFFPSVKTD